MKISPVFFNISDINSTVNSHYVPRILSRVKVKHAGVLKLFCDHPKLTWEHVSKIRFRALTSIIKGPEFAFTHNLILFLQADMDFHHFFPVMFQLSFSYDSYGICEKGSLVHFCSYGNRRRRFFLIIKPNKKNWCTSISSTSPRFFERCCHSL